LAEKPKRRSKKAAAAAEEKLREENKGPEPVLEQAAPIPTQGAFFEPPPLVSVLRVLVKFKEGVAPEQRAKIHEDSPGGIVRPLPGIDVDMVEVETLTDMGRVIAYYEAYPELIEYVEADQPVAAALIPNDPFWTTAPGQVAVPQWGPAWIKAPAAWDVTKGVRSIRIAVCDSGIDESHPDLAGRVVASKGFLTGATADDNGHGTFMAGVIGALTNNGSGMAGMVWNCELLNAKVLDANASGSISSVANGVIWAVDNGAWVINLSLVTTENNQTLAAAIAYAEKFWCVVCAATGNEGGGGSDGVINYPAGYDTVISVGGTNGDDHYSSSNANPKVWVVAPAQNILSAWNRADSTFGGGQKYYIASGTSQAAAHVSGVVALMLAVNATLSAAEIKAMLRDTAKDLGIAGRDNIFGYGIVQADKAVLRALAGGASPTPSPTPTPTPTPGQANIQVSFSASTLNARSENDLDANPLNPLHLVGCSKKFTNPGAYVFTLACYRSLDGGLSWTESAPLTLPAGTAILSDPAIAWDSTGHPYSVGLMADANLNLLGLCVHRSTDGGATWGTPLVIHQSAGDDKQDAVGDNNPASPYYGRVYSCWDDGAALRFARTTNQGASWQGTGANAPGSLLASDSYLPDMAVSPNGTIAIFWMGGSNTIKMVRSFDGGNSFTAPVVIASGLQQLQQTSSLISGGWAKLPGGNFRVVTLPAACYTDANHLIVTWADYREGVCRIYYRRSQDGGATWLGFTSGSPLLTGAVVSAGNMHDFHPVCIGAPGGNLGCAFYDFGPYLVGGIIKPRLHVVLVTSTDHGATFQRRAVVTDIPWDPTVDAPLSHGDPSTTFIGEYFGLAISGSVFVPMWTDTRTGIQEMFAARVSLT